MRESDAISLNFDNVVGDHLAAERLYYKSTVVAKVDKVVAAILALVGVFSTWAAGTFWWTLIFLPLAILEWLNLLSIRPFVIRRWFKHNPKFTETYHLVLDRSGIQFRTKSIDSWITWNITLRCSKTIDYGYSCTAGACTQLFRSVRSRMT